MFASFSVRFQSISLIVYGSTIFICTMDIYYFFRHSWQFFSPHLVSATPVSKSKATAKQKSLASHANMSSATMDLRANESDIKRVSTVDPVDKAMIMQGWEPAALYVFGDKGNLKVRFDFIIDLMFSGHCTGYIVGGFHS